MKVSKNAVARLSRYRDAVRRFKQYQVEWVFSEDIASSLGIKAAQVRKDFSAFGISGRKKVGYSVEQLESWIADILLQDSVHPAVLAGSGSLMKALLKERGLFAGAADIQAVFFEEDSDELRDEQADIPLLPMRDLHAFVQEKGIRFGCIATHGPQAQRIADSMVVAGISGILSFGSGDLKVPQRCVVSTINLQQEFERVIYFATRKMNGTRK
jgi:redox-sensing transcriptional repressor